MAQPPTRGVAYPTNSAPLQPATTQNIAQPTPPPAAASTATPAAATPNYAASDTNGVEAERLRKLRELEEEEMRQRRIEELQVIEIQRKRRERERSLEKMRHEVEVEQQKRRKLEESQIPPNLNEQERKHFLETQALIKQQKQQQKQLVQHHKKEQAELERLKAEQHKKHTHQKKQLQEMYQQQLARFQQLQNMQTVQGNAAASSDTTEQCELILQQQKLYASKLKNKHNAEYVALMRQQQKLMLRQTQQHSALQKEHHRSQLALQQRQGGEKQQQQQPLMRQQPAVQQQPAQQLPQAAAAATTGGPQQQQQQPQGQQKAQTLSPWEQEMQKQKKLQQQEEQVRARLMYPQKQQQQQTPPARQQPAPLPQQRQQQQQKALDPRQQQQQTQNEPVQYSIQQQNVQQQNVQQQQHRVVQHSTQQQQQQQQQQHRTPQQRQGQSIQAQSAFTATNMDNASTMERLCASNDWITIIRIISNNPSNCFFTHGYTVLHYALGMIDEGYSPFKVGSDYLGEITKSRVEQLLIAAPKIARIPDKSSGQLPLHQILTLEYREKMKRHYTNKPIRYKEILAQLIKAYPDALEVADSNGHLPLHSTILNDCPSEVVAMILGAYPNAAGIHDKNGYLPIHIMCARGVISIDVFGLLLDESPKAILTEPLLVKVAFSGTTNQSKDKNAKMSLMKLLVSSRTAHNKNDMAVAELEGRIRASAPAIPLFSTKKFPTASAPTTSLLTASLPTAPVTDTSQQRQKHVHGHLAGKGSSSTQSTLKEQQKQTQKHQRMENHDEALQQQQQQQQQQRKQHSNANDVHIKEDATRRQAHPEEEKQQPQKQPQSSINISENPVPQAVEVTTVSTSAISDVAKSLAEEEKAKVKSTATKLRAKESPEVATVSTDAISAVAQSLAEVQESTTAPSSYQDKSRLAFSQFDKEVAEAVPVSVARPIEEEDSTKEESATASLSHQDQSGLESLADSTATDMVVVEDEDDLQQKYTDLRVLAKKKFEFLQKMGVKPQRLHKLALEAAIVKSVGDDTEKEKLLNADLEVKVVKKARDEAMREHEEMRQKYEAQEAAHAKELADAKKKRAEILKKRSAEQDLDKKACEKLEDDLMLRIVQHNTYIQNIHSYFEAKCLPQQKILEKCASSIPDVKKEIEKRMARHVEKMKEVQDAHTSAMERQRTNYEMRMKELRRRIEERQKFINSDEALEDPSIDSKSLEDEDEDPTYPLITKLRGDVSYLEGIIDELQQRKARGGTATACIAPEEMNQDEIVNITGVEGDVHHDTDDSNSVGSTEDYGIYVREDENAKHIVDATQTSVMEKASGHENQSDLSDFDI